MKKAEYMVLHPGQLAEFLPFFYRGILTEGLIQPIQKFETADDGLRRSLDELVAHLIQGMTWGESLAALTIRFPQVLEKLLRSASNRGMLDYVLADVCKVYRQYSNDNLALYDALSLMWSEFEALPRGHFICLGCVFSAFQKIFKRAQLEKAHCVYLSQEGERYFHQKYVAVKLVHIQEASHAMTYHTLYAQLRDVSVHSGLWELLDDDSGIQQCYRVEALEPYRFLIYHQGDTLEIIFTSPIAV